MYLLLKLDQIWPNLKDLKTVAFFFMAKIFTWPPAIGHIHVKKLYTFYPDFHRDENKRKISTFFEYLGPFSSCTLRFKVEEGLQGQNCCDSTFFDFWASEYQVVLGYSLIKKTRINRYLMFFAVSMCATRAEINF